MKTPPSPARRLSIADDYHDAWLRRDYDEARRHLSNKIAIDVPINHYDSKPEFASAAQQTREMCTQVTTLAQLGDDSDAVLVYEMQLPIGPLRIAECFHVEKDKITRIVHVHDTAALRAAGMGAEGRA